MKKRYTIDSAIAHISRFCDADYDSNVLTIKTEHRPIGIKLLGCVDFLRNRGVVVTIR